MAERETPKGKYLYVEPNFYEYQGARYQSLSEIARLITGTRWSGPLFFGIKNEQGSSKLKEAK